MKFLQIAFLTLTVFFSTNTFGQTTSKIIGEWAGKDFDGNEGKFIFFEDNHASITLGNEFIDGKHYIVRGGKNDGKSGEVKYSIDYSKSPFTIDFILLLAENGKLVEKGRILGIIKFITDTEMLFAISLTGKRDSDFNKKNMTPTMTLRKNI